MLIQTANLTILVSDLDNSVDFYKALGLSLKQRWGNHYAQLEAPGITIGLHPSSPEQVLGNSGNVSIGFASDDLIECSKLLESLSVDFTERNEEGGSFLHFSDPDGTALYFIRPKW